MSDGGAGLAKLKELVERIRVGLLTTVEVDGSLHTRPIETLRCEYWERGGRASYLLAALAAAVTGRQAVIGQDQKLP